MARKKDAAFDAWVARTVEQISGIVYSRQEEKQATPQPSNEIPRAAQTAYFSGVYVLTLCQEVQYVGQSGNVISRIAQHMASAPFEFDSYFVHECKPELLTALEAEMIAKYAPKWNKMIPAYGGKKYATQNQHVAKSR